ncbi:hypothetical protein OIU79_003664, partial [Salix purpurea]
MGKSSGPLDLVAAGLAPFSAAAGAGPSKLPSPQLHASEGSPSWSELMAPIKLSSPRSSDFDSSSAYYSDSSSHYGSPGSASLGCKARLPSPVPSSPEVVMSPSVVSPAATVSGPVLQAKGQPPSVQAAVHDPNGGDDLPKANAASVDNRSTGRDNRPTGRDKRSTARSNRSTAEARISLPARKDVLISEGAAASLVDGRVQDVTSLAAGMVFEAPAPACDLARQPAPEKPSSIQSSAPMNSEDDNADCEWQLVPKKLTSNRQPKSVSGTSAVLVPGLASVASKGQAVLTTGNDSVEKGLMELGSIAASSTLGKGSDSLKGKSAGAVLQVSAAADLGLSAASK